MYFDMIKNSNCCLSACSVVAIRKVPLVPLSDNC